MRDLESVDSHRVIFNMRYERHFKYKVAFIANTF